MRSRRGFLNWILCSRTLRMILSLVFVLNTVFLIASVMSFSFLKSNGFYTTGGESLQDDVFDQLMADRSREALEYWRLTFDAGRSGIEQENSLFEKYQKEFSRENTNFYFRITQEANQEENQEDNQIIYNSFGDNINENDSSRSYYPKVTVFSDTVANDTIDLSKMTFEAHLTKELTAHDVFWRASRFFYYANTLKYVVFALMILFSAFECVHVFILYSIAVRDPSAPGREMDQVPFYFLAPFLFALGALCVVFLRRQTDALSDIPKVLSGADLEPTLYMFFLLLVVLSALLYMLITTVSVRVHRQHWWHSSLLYRTFAARGFGQRTRTVLTILTVAQFALYLVLFLRFHEVTKWVYIVSDCAFTIVLAVMLYVMVKDLIVYIPQTRRIAKEQHGFVTTDGLSAAGRKHAENVNFLSRSASAETEKRYVNESFSAKLIHSVSHGLRGPLGEVAQNVRVLEEEDLTHEQAKACTARILTLSQDLKKKIEDMILISKASTGNLPFEPVPTDTGMMLSQAVGEFYERFSETQVEPVTEQPDAPVLIRADGQYMWFVFEGILSVMLENAVQSTRLFLRTRRSGENAFIIFRCTVNAQAGQHIHDLSGMGLSSAKVFTLLQGGTMCEHLSYDTMTVVLRFPAIEQTDQTESTEE